MTRYLDQIFAPLQEYKIPWASVYGNHDIGSLFSRSDMMSHEKTFELSLSNYGPKSVHGVSNYLLLVYDAYMTKPTLVLWFLGNYESSILIINLSLMFIY